MDGQGGLAIAHIERGDDAIALRAVEDLSGCGAICDGKAIVCGVKGGNAVSDGIKVHILCYCDVFKVVPMSALAIVVPEPVVEVFVDGANTVVDFEEGGAVDRRGFARSVFFNKTARL